MRVGLSWRRAIGASIGLVFSLAVCACDGQSGKADTAAPDVANGEYIVSVVAHCAGCHSAPGTGEPGHPRFLAGNTFAGINVPNITQDTETGIGGWTDEQIEAAIRQGVRPDGSQIHPLMPWRFLAYMTDQDTADLIAFLRTVPAVANEVPRNDYDAIPFTAVSIGFPPAPPTVEEAGEDVARGGYIASMAHCMLCHTPRRREGRDYANDMGRGGNLYLGEVPAVSRNITPDMEEGIGRYSVDDIVHIFRTGETPDGYALSPIMGTRGLENARQEDLEALAAYLKWLPPRPLGHEEE